MILIIDDEPWTMEPYIRELRKSKISYVIIDTLQGGVDFINSHIDEIEIVVLDMMMPLPENIIDKEEYEGGLKAGLYVFRKIIEIEPKMPIIVLTNRILQPIKDTQNRCKNVIIRQKLDTPSFFLPQLIIDHKRIIESHHDG